MHTEGFSVDMPVRVYPGTDHETRGIVIEGFGELTFQAVDIGDTHIAPPARRWAVRLINSGELVFVNSEHLAAD
jgi:hypothetical protein